jgi:hypothetical protein
MLPVHPKFTENLRGLSKCPDVAKPQRFDPNVARTTKPQPMYYNQDKPSLTDSL